MTTRQTFSRALLIAGVMLAAGLILPACGSDPTPVLIVVTPTHDSTIMDTTPVSELPSGTPAETTAPTEPPSLTPPPTFPPDMTYGPLTGQQPSEPAAVPTGTPVAVLPPSATPASSSGIFGSIVGPNYTPMPTEIRAPPTAPSVPSPVGGTPLPTLNRAMLGIQVHPHIDSREFDLVLSRAAELGITWIKYQFNWSLLESSPGQYTELFYMLRLYVQRTHAAGFRVMISVAKAPGWSRSPDSDGNMHEDGPPDDPAALANFLGGMLNMMGYDGAGHPQIDAIEVWNEPNLAREWHNHPLTGAEYIRYFGPAYSAIKNFSPEITVITAAPAPTGDLGYSANDRTWLQQLYNAGLAQYGGNVAIGVHPYGWGNAPDARCCPVSARGWDEQKQFYFLDTLEDYHQIVQANGHDAQLWVTEFGWATFDGLKAGNGTRPADPVDTPYFSFVDQWQQANYTIRAFQLGAERSWVGPMILWNLNFSTLLGALDKSDPQAAYGLLNADWSPRPVYQLLKDAPKN